MRIRLLLLFLLRIAAGGQFESQLRCAPPSPAAIRLENLLAAASIQAAGAKDFTNWAEPIVWQDFYDNSKVTWQLARGRIGVRNGDLVVRGEGFTPVILSPKQQAIDWKLYQAVEIRMLAEGGDQVKIKIGDFEAKQKLGPAGEYGIYRFEVDINAPKGTRLLAIMPTDSLQALAAIHSIKLIPKPAGFTKPYGSTFLGKQDEYRSAIYIHSPSSMAFQIKVPPQSHFHFGLGVTNKDLPVRFRISVDGDSKDIYTKDWADPERWEDADIDLSRWSGKSITLRLATQSNREGAVALWSNPFLTTAAKRPNILLYLVDTMRADHAGVYGYARNTTPFLKKLAATGVVFEDCQAQSTWTKTSVASLMTSLYAFTHGIMGDAETIPPGAVTLGEELHAAGYVTASIAGSPYVGRATGLEKGFDYLFESPAVLRHRSAQRNRDTDSAAVNEIAFRWLDQHHEEPFFLYAHTTDPHAPYNPPAPFEAAFAKPSESAQFQRDYMSFHPDQGYGGGAVFNADIAAHLGINTKRFIQQAVDRYDGEILHNDRSLEMLAGKLQQLGVLENTLIIVVSDHGEEFLDHGWTAHGHTLYQELTHSVFVMSNPKLLPGARKVQDPVQLIDVMPTILDLVGLKLPAMIEGQSLAPLALGRPFERKGLVVASRFAVPHSLGIVPENQVDGFAILDSKWKFIYRNKAAKVGMKKVELYDRSADRAETHDVSGQHPKEVEAMIATLSQWIDANYKLRTILGHTGRTQLDQQTLNQLRSLGYLGGSPP